MPTQELPLFPLNTVLFPGGLLPLRIFEPRYLDMVGRCLRNDSGFGVVLITEGREAGGTASFHTLGTLARIVDFDRLDDGLLGIGCRGERRLRVLTHRLQPDRLVVGEVELLPDELRVEPPPRYRVLVQLLENILRRAEVQPLVRHLSQDRDAAWVAGRLAELLPLPVQLKQALLELDDPVQRLDELYALLQDDEPSA